MAAKNNRQKNKIKTGGKPKKADRETDRKKEESHGCYVRQKAEKNSNKSIAMKQDR